MVFFRGAEKKLKAAKALKERGETPEELLRSIKENEKAVAEAEKEVAAWKAIAGEKSRREEAAKAEAERIERKAAEERERAEAEEKTRIEAEKKEAERIAAEKAEEARVEAERKERDENGQPFVVSSDGTTTFGEITEDTGLTAAPIKLSEGFQDANTGKGYGLVHIEANHGEQIRQAGFTSVKEFVSFVATHYDPDNIRVGKRRDDGSDTFLIQVTDTHDNTLFIELSKDGSYWNVNSGGIFRKGYSNKKETVAKTEPQQPTNAVSSDSSLSANVKDGITNAEPNGEPTVSLDKGTTLPADQQTSDEENTKKVADSEGENTLKAKIEAASADVNTDPTEAQKEAGNYKKGHVQVGTFDITIEQPEGSIRRGTDADGKQWESKMHNTYGYFRGTEGVDGDHIDVFLSNDIDGWNGRKVFVVDQYNPDGTFDEHKVMLGFNDMDEAKSDYLANYEKGWENGRRITVSTTNLEDFEKWIDSSHRKTKPFSEYSSVNKETVANGKPEKKQKKQSVFDKAKEIADKEEKKRKAEADKPKQKPLTEAERKDAEEVAGALGYRVEWVDTMEENGTIDADKKVIRIAKDAENPLVQVLGHEVAHGVKRMDGGKFRTLQKAAKEVVGEKEWNERIEKKRELNAYAEGKLAEEVTCDIVGEALNDRDALKRLAESLRGEKGILARLRDAVAKMVEYFKNRGDKEGVRRMKAADKLLAEFESALKEDVASGQANPEGVDRSVRESGDEPENKRRKDFAERFGVDESYVSDYANGMAQKSTGKAARARRSMERQIYLADDGKTSKLSDIAKSLKQFRAALKEAFGDLDALIDEYRKLFEKERNMMEAARKKAEEEAASRKRHLDELSLLTDGQIDSRYAEALEKGDETEAREMLDEVARRKGYGDENNEYRMQHRAPSNPGYESDEARRNDIENGPDVNLEDIALGYNRQPDDYFTNPRGYGNDTPHGRESTDAVANALSSIRQGGRDVTVKVYRAVPTTMKEGKLRNGDWVTLSRRYAEMHGNHALNGKYRIMEDEVPAKDIWWDGNDVNEFGYDNGEDYKYKNVKNNRKSDDLVTRDDKGNVIPPSKRFNQRKADERYSRRESKALTEEERELRDNLVERMRKGGLDVVTDSEEMQRVIDTENERTRDMFVGERGATAADIAEERTTRLDSLSVARQMEEAKKDAKTIKMATGWERGVDGKWRYETGDAKIKDTIEINGKTFKRNEEDMLWTGGKLGDAVDAPELFKAYPELKNVRIETDAVLNDMPSNGEYNPRTNTITIHSDDLKYQNSILNHEIQHAIQHIEGFEAGGSAENVRERIQQVIDNSSDEAGYARERLREWADLNAMAAMLDVAYRKFVGSGNEWERAKAVEIYWDAINTIEDNDKAELVINYPHDKTPREVAESGYLVDDVIRELNHLADETRKEIPDGNIDTMREVDRLVGALKDKTDFELYKSIAGEVEARNTEKRIGMTEEERRASLASETEDVAREDQILLGVDNAVGEVNAGSVREHRVYHGSGADFDAFDHSHMGEGEGAQAYGWGTYVTEVEGIGRTYAVQNSKYAREYPVYNGDSHGLSEGRINEILEVFLDGVSDKTYILRAWDDAMQWYSSRKDDDYAQSLVRDASLLNPSDISIAGSKTRNLYTVEIPDDNGVNYLDWNSSLSKEQKDTITKALKRLKVDLTYYESRGFSLDDTFGDIYYFLTIALRHTRKWEDVNAIRASSKFLYSLGFTGIKYPADNMRGGRKDGAKNYVIFNENDAKITDHTRFLRTADGEVYGLVKDGRIYLDPKVATAETAVHEYTHLWGDMLRRKDAEQWSRTVKELKNSVLWEEVKELYPELKTDDEIADEVLSTFSGRRGAERLREEARRVADGEGGVFTKAKAIETLERVKEAIARFWEGVAKMFGINRYRSAEELADMAMRDLLDSKNPMKDESGMRKRGEVGDEGVKSLKGEEAMVALDNIFEDKKTENMPQKVSSLVKFMELFRKPVRTFLGEVVNVKEEVYNKIIREKRTSISGAVLPTLENADFAIRDTDGSTLYIKRFKSENNDNVYNIAVVNKYGEVEDYVSSVHIKSDNNLRNKITKGAELLLPQERITDGTMSRNNSTPDAKVANYSETAKPRLSRKPGESIFDYASRVSESVDRSVRERVSARDEYEKKVKSKGFQTKEALQNSMLGLQEFMFAIDHASGNKRYIEDIPDFENPILGENRLSSVNKEEMHQVAKTQFKPLMSAVAKLSGNGKESGELYDYMFAKHGLERDAVMRQREAQKEFDKYQKAHPKGTKTIGDFVASLEGKDYAGLTALTAEDGRVKSIQSQIDAIDEQMKATDDQLLLRYLGGQKKRLKVDLLNAARDAADDIRKAFESNPSHDRSDINELWKRVNEVNGNTLRKLYESGLLTKEAYDDISSMYTNYIPMRGFDQTTSADAYAYLTHNDSAFNAPIKTAKGRSSKADNPIAYMQAMAESAIMQGNRNVLVKQKMLNFVRNHPSDLASVSDVWLQYDSVADEWKPFYAFGRESKG